MYGVEWYLLFHFHGSMLQKAGLFLKLYFILLSFIIILLCITTDRALKDWPRCGCLIFLNYDLFLCKFKEDGQQNVLSDLDYFICANKKLFTNSVYHLLSCPRCKAPLWLQPHDFLFQNKIPTSFSYF
jgi:hypothetical protein